MTLADLVLYQCRLNPLAPAMCVPGAALPLISYGRLASFIHNIARNAQALGIKRGDIVALQVEDCILHAAFILGLNRIGAITLSTPSSVPDEIGPHVLISDVPRPFATAERFILAGMDWTEGTGEPFVPADIQERGDKTACIALTSGTTGYPRACAFTNEMLLRRTARFNWLYGRKAAECSRSFVDPSLSTSVGFLFWLDTLSRGGMVMFRGDDAIETLQALQLYSVQKMCAAPAALSEFVQLCSQAPELRPAFEAIISVGSHMPAPLSERVRTLLGSNLIASCGSTETHAIAAAPANAIAHLSGAVGYVVPDTRVEIVDESGNVLPAGREGTIRVRSPFNVTSYVGDSVDTQRAFRDDAFYPGDIGRLDTDGLLVISGREKSVLNLGGDKVSPERIEQAILSLPGVKQAAAFSAPNSVGVEELWAAVVVDSFDEAALRIHCMRQLPTAHRPARYVAVDRLPLTPAGKIDRRKLSEITEKWESESM